MKINEQYHNLNLLENVTYEFLGRDGETHEETEPILVEHMMDVYVNERLTMKLVMYPTTSDRTGSRPPLYGRYHLICRGCGADLHL